MPLDIQAGDLADRARKFMRLVGRIPFRLDETVVPVVNQQDLSQPPYRAQSGPHDWSHWVTLPAQAAAFSAAGVVLGADTLQPGAAVVDTIVLDNIGPAAVALTLVYSQVTGGLGGFALTTAAPDVEVPSSAAPAVNKLTPVFGFTAFAAAVPPGGGQPFALGIARFTLPPTTSLIVPWRTTLYANRGVGSFGLSVWCNTLNLVVSASFHGTFYPEGKNP